MGCLCPRKPQYTPPILTEQKRYLPAQPISQQNFVLDSERNKILHPIHQNEIPYRQIMSPENNRQYSPQKVFENRDSSQLKIGHGLIKSEILVSQIGGSKLERSISILSTEDDIKSL